MTEFLMKPKIDFAFKEIMTDEKARIGFLSAILKLNPNNIKETFLLKTELQKVHEDNKLGILDVKVLLNNDTEIDIEVQLSKLDVWTDRALFYLSKMYTEQIEQGQKYDVFKVTIQKNVSASASLTLHYLIKNLTFTPAFILWKIPIISSIQPKWNSMFWSCQSSKKTQGQQ